MTSLPSPPSSVSRIPPAGSDDPLSWSSPARPSTRRVSPGPASSIWTKTGSPSTNTGPPANVKRSTKSRSGVPARRVRPKAPCSSCSVVNERSPTSTRPGPPGAARSRRSTRSSSTGTPPSARARPRRGGDVEVLAGLRGRVGQPVLAAAAVDDDAVDGAAPGRVVDLPVAVEVDGQRARGDVDGDLLVRRAAGDEQPAMAQLERRRRRRVDELAVAAAGHRAAEVAADRLGERAGERLVGEVGDQDQAARRASRSRRTAARPPPGRRAGRRAARRR